MQYFTESYIVSGKADSPGASPTSVLDDSGMASWTWDSISSGSQHSSPLRSTSSQSNEAQPNHQDTTNLSKQDDAVLKNPSASSTHAPSSSNTLVETLKTCLTTLPHHSTATAMSSVSHRAINESSRKKTGSSVLPASNNSGSAASKVSSGASSKPLGVVGTKPTKRRPRASRRVPTTVLEASCNEFRDMVQKLTGIPAGHHASKGEHHGGAVRPQPIRPGMANGSLVDRPEVPMPSPYGTNANHSSPYSAIGFLQELQRKSSSFPFISMKTEGGADQLGINQRLTDLTNAAPPEFSSTAPSWGSAYNNMRAAAGQLDQTSLPGHNFQEDSLSLSQIDSWLHNDLQPSEMRV